MITNFGKRAWDRNYDMDPIVRSRMDQDAYKLIMAQVIRKEWPNTQVSFALRNRTVAVKLGREIDIGELRAQLDHVRSLRFGRSELVYLAGNTFFGEKGIFSPDFIRWLDEEHRLPDYELFTTEDGQIAFRSEGLWEDVSQWEIHVLTIVNEMRHRSALKQMGEFDIDVAYARAKATLAAKLDLLSPMEDIRLSDFGTRRRHSFLWQEYCVRALREKLPKSFLGTSNMLLAMKYDLEAIGTNAHEMPMVLAALADTDEEMVASQYEVLKAWERSYGENLRIFLPDTYGTEQFLRNAPDWVADWTGMRADSADPFRIGLTYSAWLKERGRDPKTKRFIASDGLDAGTIRTLQMSLGSTFRLGFGWGTMLTNDFRATPVPGLQPISLVCKVTEANGRPAVKLSDNPEKATGPADVLARYRRVFGVDEANQAGDRIAPVV